MSHQGLAQNEQKCQLKVVDSINLLGVKLARTTTRTRELNSSELVASFQSKLNHFKAGRHSALVLKPHLANVYLLSKISQKAAAVHLVCTDVKKIQSTIRSLVTQELLKNPPDVLLFINTAEGGLGQVNVSARTMANLTRNFLQFVHLSPLHALRLQSLRSRGVREQGPCKKTFVLPTVHLRPNQGGFLRYKGPHLFPVHKTMERQDNKEVDDPCTRPLIGLLLSAVHTCRRKLPCRRLEPNMAEHHSLQTLPQSDSK